MLYCSLSIETKLESMAGDGLRFIQLLWKAHFEKDGTKQVMLEIAEVVKRLMLCWQKPGMMIDTYTMDLKAKIKVCKAVRSAIDISEATTKLAC